MKCFHSTEMHSGLRQKFRCLYCSFVRGVLKHTHTHTHTHTDKTEITSGWWERPMFLDILHSSFSGCVVIKESEGKREIFLISIPSTMWIHQRKWKWLVLYMLKWLFKRRDLRINDTECLLLNSLLIFTWNFFLVHFSLFLI